MKVSGKPAKHSKTRSADTLAISLLKSILARHDLVDPSDLREGDTLPNHDGHLVILDTARNNIGEIIAQVKALSPSRINSKISHRFPDDKFLSFCNTTRQYPTIFIGVDRQNEVAYWEEITPELIKKLPNKTLYLKKGNIISKDNKDYYDYWKKSCEVRVRAISTTFKHKEFLKSIEEGKDFKLQKVSPNLINRSQKKLQNLFISQALKLRYYPAFIDLLEPFYLDSRGAKQRKRLRFLFNISESEEKKFIQVLVKKGIIKQVGELCVVQDQTRTQGLLEQVINKGHINLADLLKLFS